jgi:hypothetical protein
VCMSRHVGLSIHALTFLSVLGSRSYFVWRGVDLPERGLDWFD